MVEIVNSARPDERPRIDFKLAVMEKFMAGSGYNRPYAYDGDTILITLRSAIACFICLFIRWSPRNYKTNSKNYPFIHKLCFHKKFYL